MRARNLEKSTSGLMVSYLSRIHQVLGAPNQGYRMFSDEYQAFAKQPMKVSYRRVGNAVNVKLYLEYPAFYVES